MEIKSWLLIVLFLINCLLCESAKILVVFPLPGKSHSILGMGVCRNLLEAGHEVTYLTPFPPEKPHRNLSIIDISENQNLYENVGISTITNIKSFMYHRSYMRTATNMYNFVTVAKLTINNKNVQAVFGDPKQNFDLVIMEWLFNEVYVGIPAVFNCPYIWVSTMEPNSLVMRLIDEGMHPAYNAGSHSGNVVPFTFYQRVVELFGQVVWGIFKEFFLGRTEKLVYEEVFTPLVEKRGRKLPPFEDMLYNASVMFGNSHASMGAAPRLPQSYKEIGGYHIDPKTKSLPEDIKKIMDDAIHGVIFFSMGSNLKSKDLPDQIKADLLEVFGGLKQTVLWKFEEILPNLPANVHVVNWAPQQSILSHPNCILFITHGGLLSITEAIHFGVPLIGIPVFSDQFININNAVKKGFGKRVDLSHTMAGELEIAINAMIDNPEYRNKAKEISLIYHDRRVPPGIELAHWAQHVIRTKGAPHLRSPALMVPWYQKLYLDFLVVVLSTIFALKKVFGIICGLKKKTNFVFDSKKKD